MCFCLSFLFFLPLIASEDHHYLVEGTACNNYLLYEDALKNLDKAIKLRPSNREAYEERAIAYFELNRIDLALKDYEESKKKNLCRSTNLDSWNNFGNDIYDFEQRNLPLFSLAPSYPSLDFATGLLEGVWYGSEGETIEFLSCIRGSFNALWAFACSPVEVSRELVEATRAMGEYLTNTDIWTLLEEALPELVECGRYWDSWSEHTKGKKMGYIIGKYGISVFLYLGVSKGLAIFNDLKRANMMATLERYSLTKSATILKESEKCVQKNIYVLKKIQQGYIIPQNANVASHVLQKKHDWHKVVKLTGNKDADFKIVSEFLKQERILSCEGKLDWSYQSLKTYRYKKEIGNNTIVAVFEINAKNEPFLRNAWIAVTPPYGP